VTRCDAQRPTLNFREQTPTVASSLARMCGSSTPDSGAPRTA